MLIANGARIDEPDSKSWRPLHYAAFSGSKVMVQLLLERGASPHSTTSEGNTPLSLGFREPGQSISQEDKEIIMNALHDAMISRRKSKMRQFSDLMNVGNKSRDVGERNKIWHTAELAAALYQSMPDDDETSELQPSISSQHKEDLYDEDEAESVVAGSSRVAL
jgi:hypothetical protein